MPLPKLVNPDEHMIKAAKGSMDSWDSILSNQTAKAAMGALSNADPKNQKLQNLCTTYFQVCQALENMETTKVGSNWAENFSIASKGMATLAGYDENGAYHPEDSLVSVANSAFGKNGFTSAYHLSSLVKLDGACSTNVMHLNTLDNQLHALQTQRALNIEEEQTKRLGDTSYEFFHQLNEKENKYIKEALSNDDNLKKSYDNIDKTVSSMEKQIKDNSSNYLNGGSFDQGMNRMKENEKLTGNIEKAKQWKQAISAMAEKRDTIYSSCQKLSVTQKHADQHLAAAQKGLGTDTFVNQLKDVLDKNLKQIDQGKRLFHRDSKEFTAMKTSLQDVRKYLDADGGKPDMKKLSEMLQKMHTAADTYETTKLASGKEYGRGSTMRDSRLGMAQTLKNISMSTLRNIDGIGRFANTVAPLAERVNKARAARAPLDTSSKEAFMTTGSAYAENRLQQQMTQLKKTENQPTVQKTNPSVQNSSPSVKKKESPLAMIHQKQSQGIGVPQ